MSVHIKSFKSIHMWVLRNYFSFVWEYQIDTYLKIIIYGLHVPLVTSCGAIEKFILKFMSYFTCGHILSYFLVKKSTSIFKHMVFKSLTVKIILENLIGDEL